MAWDAVEQEGLRVGASRPFLLGGQVEDERHVVG